MLAKTLKIAIPTLLVVFCMSVASEVKASVIATGYSTTTNSTAGFFTSAEYARVVVTATGTIRSIYAPAIHIMNAWTSGTHQIKIGSGWINTTGTCVTPAFDHVTEGIEEEGQWWDGHQGEAFATTTSGAGCSVVPGVYTAYITNAGKFKPNATNTIYFYDTDTPLGDETYLYPTKTRIISTTLDNKNFPTLTSSRLGYYTAYFNSADLTNATTVVNIQTSYIHYNPLVANGFETQKFIQNTYPSIEYDTNDTHPFGTGLQELQNGTYLVYLHIQKVTQTVPEWWEFWKSVETSTTTIASYGTKYVVGAGATTSAQDILDQQNQDEALLSQEEEEDSIYGKAKAFADDFLRVPPLGYAYHIYELMSTSSPTSTLSMTLTIPTGMPGEGKTLTLDAGQGIADSWNTLGAISVDTIDGSPTDKFMFYWEILWYGMVVFAIFGDIFGVIGFTYGESHRNIGKDYSTIKGKQRETISKTTYIGGGNYRTQSKSRGKSL